MSQELEASLDWLFSTQMFGIKLGLESTRSLLEAVGALPCDGVKVVHVAGTNGKGSTCAMIEALARAKGYRTGLFTSPHLVHFSERIRVNGDPIGDDDLLRQLNFIRELAESSGRSPTFFELAFVLAMKYFAEQRVNFIVLETGLGGRLDSTNSVDKDVAVLVPVAMDHQQYLGDTLTAVASEKAGIISWDKPVVTAVQEEEVLSVIRERARELNAPLFELAVDADVSGLSLAGPHQRKNAALAIEALKAIDCLPPNDVVLEVLAHISWPGRFEWVSEYNCILDGAHNPHAMKALVQTWKERFGEKKAQVIFAASEDKNITDIIKILDDIVNEWFLVPGSSPRILDSEKMKDIVEEISSNPVKVYSDLGESLDDIKGSPIPALVTGSLFLIGDVKARMLQAETRSTKQ